MHIRRGEFQYEETRICADEALRHTENLAPAGGTVYLATDETDAEFLRPFRERFQLVRYCDLPEMRAVLGLDEPGCPDDSLLFREARHIYPEVDAYVSTLLRRFPGLR